MISPEEFVRRWEAERRPSGEENTLIRFPRKLVESLLIPDEDKEFLLRAGLPLSAAPCLAFDPQEGESWSILAGDLPSDDYRRIYLIGSNGCGDPIAIDGTANGKIVVLFHEIQFGRGFVNSSIRHLAESLLTYQNFVRAVNNKNGDDAYINGNIPPELRKGIEEVLFAIDRPALHAKGLWREELDTLDYLIRDFHKPVADFSKGII